MLWIAALFASSSAAASSHDDIPVARDARPGPNGTRYRVAIAGHGPRAADDDLVTFRSDVYLDRQLASVETKTTTEPLRETDRPELREMQVGEVRVIWGTAIDCSACDHFTTLEQQHALEHTYAERLELIAIEHPGTARPVAIPPKPAQPCVFPEVSDPWSSKGCDVPLPAPHRSSHGPDWVWPVLTLLVLAAIDLRFPRVR